MKKLLAIFTLISVLSFGQDKKISQLGALPSVNGTELIPVARSGANYYMTTSQILPYIVSNTPLNNGLIWIGNSGNLPQGQLPTLSATPGTFTLSNTGVFTFPNATTSLRGLLSSTDWNTFNNKIGGSGTTNYLPKFTGSSTLGNSLIFDNGAVGINTTSPSYTLDVNGSGQIGGSNFISSGGLFDATNRYIKYNNSIIFADFANFRIYDTQGTQKIAADFSARTFKDANESNVIDYSSTYLQLHGTNADADVFGSMGNNLRIGGDANGTAGNGLYFKAYSSGAGLWRTGIKYLNSSAVYPDLSLQPNGGNVIIGEINPATFQYKDGNQGIGKVLQDDGTGTGIAKWVSPTTFTAGATSGSLNAGYGLSGTAFNGATTYTWTADSTVLASKPYVTAKLGGYLPLTGGSVGSLTLTGNMTFTATTNSSLTGANARIPSHPSSNIVFTNASLTSIASANNVGIADGHTLLITNATGGNLTIVNSYTGAAAGESILTGDGDLTVPNQQSIWMQYEGTASAWTVIDGGTFAPRAGSTAITTIGTATATSLYINGAGGNGFLSLTTQTATPSSPSSGTILFSNSNSKLSWRGSANTFMKTFDAGNNSADRIYSLPNRDAKLDSLTTSTSTALNGFIKGTGSVLSAISSTGTNSVVLSTGATVTTMTATSCDLTSTTNSLSVNTTQPIYSGFWRHYPMVEGINSSTGFAGSTIFFIPYIVNKRHFVTDIGVEVTTAATGSLSIALYSDSSGAPCNLIEASGNLATSGTVTTGNKTYTFTGGTGSGGAQLCDPNVNQLMWLGIQISSSSIGVRYALSTNTLNVKYRLGDATNLWTWTRTGFSYAAFPSKALGAANAGSVPLIGLKVQ